jgi:biofilm PGA synthesis protein PgaA
MQLSHIAHCTALAIGLLPALVPSSAYPAAPTTPTTVVAPAGTQLDTLKQRALTAARRGEYPRALGALDDLAAQHPDRVDVLQDKVVVLIWAGRGEEAVGLYETLSTGAAPPAYVARDVARAYRDLKQFEQAEAIYRLLLARDPADPDAMLGLALVRRDLQDLPAALAAVNAGLLRYPDNVGLHLAKVHIHLDMGNTIAALKTVNGLLLIAPRNPAGLNLKARTISDLGSADAALRFAHQHAALITPDTMVHLQGNMAARRIGWREPAVAIALLDKLIAEEPEEMSRVRARYDRILALFPLHRMQAIIDAYDELLEHAVVPPYWITDAAAGANLNLKRPRRAEALYREVLEIKPANFDARFGLYSALVDQGRFRAAEDVRAKLMAETPEWLMERGVLRYNWRKQSVMLAEGWLAAYQDRQAQARDIFKEALEVAPASVGVRTGLGVVEGWRAHPNAALEELSIVVTRGGETPPHLPSHLAERELAAKNGRIAALNNANYRAKARESSERSLTRNSHSLHVQKLNRQMQSEDRFSIYLDAVSLSEAPGLDEYYFLLELTQPITHWLSAYYSYFHRETSSDETIVQKRHAVGVDIDLLRTLKLRQEVSTDQDEPSDDGYLTVLTYSPDDKWRFSGSHNTFSLDVPFRARVNGQVGSSSALAVRYRDSEMFSCRAGVLLNELDDGNDNVSYLASLERRLLNRGYWKTHVMLEYGTSENSRTDVDYFSPEHASSLYFSHILQHTVFRRYDDAFVHRLHVGVGSFDQALYDPEPIWHIRYEHDYLINDRLVLLWGVNFKTRSYDGEKTDVTSWYLTARKTF